MQEQALTTQNGDDTELIMDDTNLITGHLTPAQMDARKARLEQIQNLNTANAQRISSEYWEASAGDTIRGIFLGFKILKKKDSDYDDGYKKMPAVVIDTIDGMRISAAMQLVDSFKTNVLQDEAVQVTCTHAKSGEMKRFEVHVFRNAEEAEAHVIR
ncbi:MAG: hypothetical protein AAFU67_17840 [Bacteroidota bacterium]